MNSLGLLDLVQIAAAGLAPKCNIRYLADSKAPAFRKLQPLAVLKTNPDGAGIVQAIGPLKVLAEISPTSSTTSSKRFLIAAHMKDASQVVLRQTNASSGP